MEIDNDGCKPEDVRIIQICSIPPFKGGEAIEDGGQIESNDIEIFGLGDDQNVYRWGCDGRDCGGGYWIIYER